MAILNVNNTEEVTSKQYDQWLSLLRDIPVSVNNFYGDPTLQWNNTLNKLDNLRRSEHSGPVSIITKGKLSPRKIDELAEFNKDMKLVVLVSISELTQFEKVPQEHRYENLRMLEDAGIANVAYIRPMTPPYNTSEEVISRIFNNLDRVGAKTVVASGFRGDEHIVQDMSPQEQLDWTLRVKLMSGEVYGSLKTHAQESGINLFTRTSCATSQLLGQPASFNPYYHSPNLVKCEELACPIIDTCKAPEAPKEGSLEFLEFLGYNAQFVQGDRNATCNVSGENRLSCPSCCTTCYIVPNNQLRVDGDVSLGDLAFIRFATGVLTTQPGIKDTGSKEIGKLNFPNFPEITDAQCINTWWPYASNIEPGKCFGCGYCIVEKYYNDGIKKAESKDVGFPPSLLLDKVGLDRACYTK